MRKSTERKGIKRDAGDERKNERKREREKKKKERERERKSRPPPRVGAHRLLRIYLRSLSTTLSEDLDVKARDS